MDIKIRPMDTAGQPLKEGDYVRATALFDEKMIGRHGSVHYTRHDGLIVVQLFKAIEPDRPPEIIVSAPYLWELQRRTKDVA